MKKQRKKLKEDPYYKSLSFFLIGTIGIIMVIYIVFGLVMTTIKAERLIGSKKMNKKVPSEVGMIRRDIGDEKKTELIKDTSDTDVIVKEVFGKITAINGSTLTVEAKIYGDELENIRLKFDEEGDGEIFKYEKNDQDEDIEVKMQLDELKEGMYLGVKLPVEVLLSEIEKDVIYVDDMLIDIEYEEEIEN